MIRGFILSAGFGERLKPITDYIPKPLLPILGKPIVDYIVEKFVSSGIKEIGLNIHYKQESFFDWVENNRYRDSLKIFVEDAILGTGGAFKNANSFLQSTPLFITHNADIFSDFDISEIVNAHNAGRYLATLAVVDYPPINSLCIDDKGLLSESSSGLIHKRRTFTGIAVYSSDIINLIPSGYSSIVDTWTKALRSGALINTFDISGYYWSDIGSPDSYAKTIFDLLQNSGKKIYISNDFKDCELIDYEGYLVIEKGCKINKPSVFNNAIIMPHTEIINSITTSCNIVGNNFLIKLNDDILKRPLGTGGSNRIFVRDMSEKVVRMYCPKGDTDFHWHINLTQYLQTRNIPVPRLINYSKEDYFAVFEDLGDLSLYDWLTCERTDDEILDVYGKVVDEVIKLHVLSEDDVFKALGLREFDYEYFCWETNYFIENFVKILCKIDVDESVYSDLNNLAKRASSFKKTIVHRDLQSQNIMIKPDKSIAFIDYQSARLGPSAYDIASLCFDPYVRLSDELRDKICNLYITKRLALNGFDEMDFKDSLSVCRLQRLMQALGAYSFLSVNKGKLHFQQHIPEGLILLKKSLSDERQSYPSLYNLIKKI